MRIIEDSPTHLKLQESTARVAVLLLCCAVVIAAIVIVRQGNPKQFVNSALFTASALFFLRISRVDLDKITRRCTIWRLDMWRRSEQAIPFDDIADVYVEVMRPNTSVQVLTRLVVVTSAGNVPLTAGYRANLGDHIELRKAIVDVVFAGRALPKGVEAARILADAGRPVAAARS